MIDGMRPTSCVYSTILSPSGCIVQFARYVTFGSGGGARPVGCKGEVQGEDAGCRSEQINYKNVLEYEPTFLKGFKDSNLDSYHIGIYGICPQVSIRSVCVYI